MADMKAFWTKYTPELSSSGASVRIRGPNSGKPTGEGSLDVEYLSSMGAGAATEYWAFAGHAPGHPDDEPFLDFMLQLANTSDAEVPRVVSTSYGECETEVEPADRY